MKTIPGNTKLVELKRIEKRFNLTSKIYAKVENSNPTGSIKDRTVFNMLNEYVRIKGDLRGCTIIEATSGNTGISLAYFAKEYGYKCIIIMPSSMSQQRRDMIAQYGAELVLVNGGMKECNEKALELIDTIPNSFIFDQFNQPSNFKAHFTTAEEIISQNSNTKYVFAGVGTGGTITGIGTYFKQNGYSVKMIGIEPEESPLLTKGYSSSHLIQGIGANFIPSILDQSIIEKVVDVKGLEAIEMAKLVRELEHIDCGISSGAALIGMINYIKENNIKEDCVAIFPDKGDRYSW